MIRKFLLAGILAAVATPAGAAVYIGDGKDDGIEIQATAIGYASAYKSSGSSKNVQESPAGIVIPESVIPLGYAPTAPLALSTDTAEAVDTSGNITAVGIGREDITATFASTAKANVSFVTQTAAGSNGRDSETYGVAGGFFKYNFYTSSNATFSLDYSLTGPNFTNSYVRLENVYAVFNPNLIDFNLSGSSLSGTLTADLNAGGIYRLTIFRGANDPAIDGSYAKGAGQNIRTQTDMFSFNIAAAAQASPTPEPASWAMMLSGFGFIGGAMRFRRQHQIAFS